MQETMKCHSKVTGETLLKEQLINVIFFAPFYFLPNFFTCMHLAGEQRNQKMKKNGGISTTF